MQQETLNENPTEVRKFDFGPRVNWSRPKGILPMDRLHVESENIHANNLSVFQSQVGDLQKQIPTASELKPVAFQPISSVSQLIVASTDTVHATLIYRIEFLESENAELRKGLPQESLGDLLVEMELDSLREEVARLTALVKDNTELANSKLRCAELEAAVVVLKKDKAALEQKNSTSRNADSTRIRELQEQVTHERSMRERIVKNESSLLVVNVGERSATPPVRAATPPVRPRAQVPVPSFVAVPAPKPSFLDKTMVLPPMLADIGDDAIAQQWKACLAEKPANWRMLLSRSGNVFTFGGLKVACKQIGNRTMIQLGRETMLLETFVETHGPKTPVVDAATAASTPVASVTMKKLLAAKANIL